MMLTALVMLLLELFVITPYDKPCESMKKIRPYQLKKKSQLYNMEVVSTVLLDLILEAVVVGIQQPQC